MVKRNFNVANVTRYIKQLKHQISYLCEKLFLTKSELETHMKVHTQYSIENLHKYSECDKSFNNDGELCKHMTIHKEKTLYNFIQCDDSF